MKTNKLAGYALNYAVALAEQKRDDPDRLLPVEWHLADFCNNWDQGGPIIKREGIKLSEDTRGLCCAYIGEDGLEHWADTPLIAAMRCYVASVLGDEVNIPHEIKEAEQWN